MVTPSPASLFHAVWLALDPERLADARGICVVAVSEACSAIRATMEALPSRLVIGAHLDHDVLSLSPEKMTGQRLDDMRAWWAARESEALALEALDDAGDAERGAALARELEGRPLGARILEAEDDDIGRLAALVAWQAKCREAEAQRDDALHNFGLARHLRDRYQRDLDALRASASFMTDYARDLGLCAVCNGEVPSEDGEHHGTVPCGAECPGWKLRAALSRAPAPTVEPAVDLDAIEARARAATPGPWQALPYDIDGEHVVKFMGSRDSHWLSADNAAHIAGMDPPTTLRLCAELRRLRGERPAGQPGGEMGVTAGEETGR